MEGGYQVQPVLAHDCALVWKDVRDLLIPAIEATGGRWKAEYVFTALLSGQQTLWVITQNTVNLLDDPEHPGTVVEKPSQNIVAALCTAVANYPERRALVIHYLGGDGLDGWYRPMHDTMVEYARSQGCDMIECLARPGFWKWFQQDDFEKTAIFYEKKI